jgi:hypothetical protein
MFSFLNFSVLSFLVLSSDPARRWTEQVLPSFFQYTGTREIVPGLSNSLFSQLALPGLKLEHTIFTMGRAVRSPRNSIRLHRPFISWGYERATGHGMVISYKGPR